MIQVMPSSKNKLNDSSDTIDIKNEIEKAAIMTIETNYIYPEKKVEKIFLMVIEHHEILAFLFKLFTVSNKSKILFYKSIKSALLATATGIRMNMNKEEIILLGRAALLYSKDRVNY